MQLSALLTLLPLAAALPQARGPVEARAENETPYSIWAACDADLNKCFFNCPFNLPFSVPTSCRSKCYQIFDECKTNQTEKRTVEEAPVEARDSKNECRIALDQCCYTTGLQGEYRNMMLAACPSECWDTFAQCKANQTEKRAVEEVPVKARDNHAGDVTDCYDDVADCKADGGSIEKCYAPLKDCLWNLYYKYFD
ncbi:hypothetical protein THARTR1_03646 [Trichoderma harzianum]|uniref:Uncharacterized protein n=1 Tax=Trichoderma harzianum TaxID=5544 RepID=A0A2K0UEB1_TRIHA|nr:hypothetical protein THARTR1_03646 [Trichoderma harzianum]